jgi:hypothetical protein
MKKLNEFLNEGQLGTGIIQGNSITSSNRGKADSYMIQDAIHSEIWRGDVVDNYDYGLDPDVEENYQGKNFDPEEYKQKYYDEINSIVNSKKKVIDFFIKNFDLYLGQVDYFVPKRHSKKSKNNEYSLRNSTLVKDKKQFKETLTDFLSEIK